MVPPLLILLLAACHPDDKGETGDTPGETGDPDETGASGETGETSESGDSADSGDSVDSGDPVDADGDGSPVGEDCDDTNPAVHPGATEVCNAVDDDCDTLVDEDAGAPWYTDADGDGDGDPAGEQVACTQPAGTVTNTEDCDDTDPERSTHSPEVCGDGEDDDCDGDIDETCIPSGPLDVSLAQTEYTSGAKGDVFGIALAPIDDWTGDGVPEVAIGASMDNVVDTSAGAVYVFDGAETGRLTGTDAIGRGFGGAYDFSYGQFLAPSPDLDGDGVGELLVGIPGWSYDPGLVAGSGGLAVVTGVSGGSLDQAALWEFHDEYSNGGLGATAADVDGDGAVELFVGAYTWGYPDTSGGRLYVIPTASVLAGGDINFLATALDGPEGTWAGYGVSDAGDLDGDGDHELVVGSGGQGTDVAWVIDGLPTGGDLADWARTTFTGEPGDYDGFVASAPADLDGDGLVDLVVSAPWDDTSATNAGAVFVFDGGVTGDQPLTGARLTLTGETASAFAGSAVSTAGDLDADGREDLLVGAKWENAYAGRAYVVAGAPTGTVSLGASWITIDPVTTEQLGFDVDGTADFTGDGVADLLLSSLPSRWGASSVFRWAPGT